MSTQEQGDGISPARAEADEPRRGGEGQAEGSGPQGEASSFLRELEAYLPPDWTEGRFRLFDGLRREQPPDGFEWPDRRFPEGEPVIQVRAAPRFEILDEVGDVDPDLLERITEIMSRRIQCRTSQSICLSMDGPPSPGASWRGGSRSASCSV